METASDNKALPVLLKDHLIPDDQDIAIYLHHNELPPTFHSHDFYEISYCLDGEADNHILHTTISMKKGDVCIISPSAIHSVEAKTDDCSLMNILVRANTFQDVFLDVLSEKNLLSTFFYNSLSTPAAAPFLLFHTGEDTKLKGLLHRLQEEYSSQLRYKRFVLKNILNSFFLLTLRDHEADAIIPNPSGKKNDPNIVYIINYLEANYTHITLKELADFFQYSERQMIRLIKDYSNSTFKNIVDDLKLRKADELLSRTMLSMEDIADQLGFSSASSFYRFYKRQTGNNPSRHLS